MTSFNRHIENTIACYEYFHGLWLQLKRLLGERRDQKLREQREFKKICGAVESIVEGTDARLRGVCNYRNQLRDGACGLLQHIEGLVDSMPDPIRVDENALVCDPMVRSILSDTKTLNRLFVFNRHIQAFFNTANDAQQDVVFALLFLRYREKRILGSEMHGEILMREVQQTALSFYAHRLIAPSPSEETVRVEMIISLFESVVRHIKNLMLQQKLQLMKQQNDFLAASPEQNINNPEVYIRLLVEQLSIPERLITRQDKLVRLNSMGIKLPLESDIPSNLLRLNEIQVGDRQSNLVSIICYPKGGFSERIVADQVHLLADEFRSESCQFPP